MIGLLAGALQQLDVEFDMARAERIGVMVHRGMSAQQRNFHTPEHIFDLADESDPHVTLAALFHDLVYYQVDRGFSADIGDLLEPYVLAEDSSLRIRDDIAESDRAFNGCAGVFGFERGQTLPPFGGLNEFLSALVMDVLLEGTVPDVDLLVATACIEGTIPFRAADENGTEPAEQLHERVKAVNRSFQLGLSDADLLDVTVRASRFANRDVYNFAEEDVARFLDNTWRLLPETNPSLRFGGVYTIQSYAVSLMKMQKFMGMLRAETVFHQFNGYPEDEVYAKLLQLTTRNLRIGRRYLGIKLVSAGTLHALAQLTGGDAPVSLFMGDLHPEDDYSTLVAHLPTDSTECGRGMESTDDLYRLLSQGRAEGSRFDLKNSPLSLFVYRCLSDEQLDGAVDAAHEMFSDTRSPESFLATLPPFTVAAIAQAASKLAFTRERGLLKISQRHAET
jgi:hypothetical protein